MSKVYEGLNATHLFDDQTGIKPSRSQHLEHWWTALFSIFLLSRARENGRLSLYKVPPKNTRNTEGDFGELFQPRPDGLDLSGLSYKNIRVESGNLRGFLHDDQLPASFHGLKPDLALMTMRNGRKVLSLIENKTAGAHPGKLATYVKATEDLRRHGIEAKTYVLISLGFPGDAVWEIIEDEDLPVILWEDILRKMDEVQFFRELFAGHSLEDYYKEFDVTESHRPR